MKHSTHIAQQKINKDITNNMTIISEKILVIKLSALGDFIQAMGPMAAIRKHHPSAKITLLTTSPFKKFAQECGYFDDIILDKRPKWYQLNGWFALRKTLITGHYTRVYDLQNNDRSALYFNLFPHHKKPEWVRVARGASHRNTSPERTAGHAFDGHKQNLELAGIQNITVDPLEWMKGDISTFALSKPYILLAPGCAPNRPEKRWPAEKFGALANALNDLGYQPVIIGTAAEQEAMDVIATMCPNALNLGMQTSLYQIAELARGATAAIGNDTGPMHLIGVTNCPCLVLFSQHSNPVQHAPKGDFIEVIQVKKLNDLTNETVIKKLSPLLELKGKTNKIIY